MDSTDVSGLRDIMDRKLPLISAYARNTLVAAGKLNYSEPLYFPNILKATYIEYPDSPEEESQVNSCLNIFPVPAKDYCIIAYRLPLYASDAEIQIVDLNGRILRSIMLYDKEDQQVTSLENLNTGVYLFRLIADDKVIESKKISLIE